MPNSAFTPIMANRHWKIINLTLESRELPVVQPRVRLAEPDCRFCAHQYGKIQSVEDRAQYMGVVFQNEGCRVMWHTCNRQAVQLHRKCAAPDAKK